MSDASNPADADRDVQAGAGDEPPAPDPENAESDSTPDESPTVGEYTWADFMAEHGHEDEAESVYRDVRNQSRSGLLGRFIGGEEPTGPNDADWDRVDFSPEEWLGFPPESTSDRFDGAKDRADDFRSDFGTWVEETPVVKDEYTWEHFKWEYHYEDGYEPRDENGETVPFEPEEHLGFDPEDIKERLAAGAAAGDAMRDLEAERTVNVDPHLDEDAFFSTVEGHTTLTNRYDLEKAVSMGQKRHFVEMERYWVNKPYAFVIIFQSLRENEKKYYLITPYLNDIEDELKEYLSGKLRTAIKYSDEDVVIRGSEAERRAVLERETRRLLDRYGLYSDPDIAESGWLSSVFGDEDDVADIDDTEDAEDASFTQRVQSSLPGLGTDDDRGVGSRLSEGVRSLFPSNSASGESDTLADAQATPDGGTTGELEGVEARPEPVVLEEDAGDLTEYQVEKLLHILKRNFLGYERIDGIKHDINVEDVSCDGYETPVFVYHTDYENLITNVQHDPDELDDFVVKLAQRSGKGISQRRPQVDATLPDGSRAQLTLGEAVSDHGTNYTIRQFKDVPFTPVDLINWQTFSLEQMAFLWLCIENNRSLIFAGGTASGKTTSLNAVSLFIPNNTKIVSIEDTREVELPQRNWVASVTRPAFGTSDKGDIDEFDLLEAALRQRPDYIVMGEVRGEEGRTLFQVMSTGHTTLTTFHADTVGEVLKRFTTDPINVSKTLFTSLDLVSVQTQTRVQGKKVRRSKALTEINHYDPENDEINVQDVFQWEPEVDDFRAMGQSNTLEEIKFDRGWNQDQLERKLFERRVVLAHLVVNGLNEYAQVAATLQGFINDSETILTLIAKGTLEERLDDLRQMESVEINVNPKKEALVPRPDPDEGTYERAQAILEEAEKRIFEEYRSREAESLVDVLTNIDVENDVTAESGRGERLREMLREASLAVETDDDSSAETDEEETDADAETDANEAADSDSDSDANLDVETATGTETESEQETGAETAGTGETTAAENTTAADAAAEDDVGGSLYDRPDADERGDSL